MITLIVLMWLHWGDAHLTVPWWLWLLAVLSTAQRFHEAGQKIRAQRAARIVGPN